MIYPSRKFDDVSRRACGILLVGGAGTRLFPATFATNKQLLPIYDKPMFYYPLETLMSAGIRKILIISQSEFIPLYRHHLGNGSSFGCDFSYAQQDEPRGIADAFRVAQRAKFVTTESLVALALGDNIFHGTGLGASLRAELLNQSPQDCAAIYLSSVNDPQRYGVAQFNENDELVDIVEKPEHPPSPWAVTGFYVYPAQSVFAVAEELNPSLRGELEITDINRFYLQSQRLRCSKLPQGTAWLDTGTPEAMLAAAQYIHAVQTRQNCLIGSPHATAIAQGWADPQQMRQYLAQRIASYYSRCVIRQIQQLAIADTATAGLH